MRLLSMVKRIPAKLVICVAVCVGLYAAWNIVYPSGSWRYKLTVEIETPEGIKTGSAVREVHAEEIQKFPFPDAQSTRYRIKGEAVVVDLGARGQVFALLPTYSSGTDGWRYIVYRVFPTSLQGRARINYYQSLTGQSKVLDAGEYPLLVRFRDPQDPKTVENLLEISACPEPNPHRMKSCLKNDRFAEAFGEGVKLKSVIIEMTREPVTKGVMEMYAPRFSNESSMGWLSRSDFLRSYK